MVEAGRTNLATGDSADHHQWFSSIRNRLGEGDFRWFERNIFSGGKEP